MHKKIEIYQTLPINFQAYTIQLTYCSQHFQFADADRMFLWIEYGDK